MVVFFFFSFSFSSFSFFSFSCSFPSSSSSFFSFFLYSPPLLAPLILASLLIFAFTREAFRLRQRRPFGPAVSKVEKKEERRREDRRDPDGIWTSIRRRVVIVIVIVSWFAVVFGSMAIRLSSVDYIRVTRIHRVICNLYDEAAAACVLFCNTDRLTGHP